MASAYSVYFELSLNYTNIYFSKCGIWLNARKTSRNTAPDCQRQISIYVKQASLFTVIDTAFHSPFKNHLKIVQFLHIQNRHHHRRRRFMIDWFNRNNTHTNFNLNWQDFEMIWKGFESNEHAHTHMHTPVFWKPN